MSPRAAAYQSRITGLAEAMSYQLKGVKFDRFKYGVLVDAKGAGYAKPLKNGEFRPWFRGQDSLVEQAIRQTCKWYANSMALGGRICGKCSATIVLR